jgi:hypothetical protein
VVENSYLNRLSVSENWFYFVHCTFKDGNFFWSTTLQNLSCAAEDFKTMLFWRSKIPSSISYALTWTSLPIVAAVSITPICYVKGFIKKKKLPLVLFKLFQKYQKSANKWWWVENGQKMAVGWSQHWVISVCILVQWRSTVKCNRMEWIRLEVHDVTLLFYRIKVYQNKIVPLHMSIHTNEQN